MSIALKTCYGCGRILQGQLDDAKKKPSRLGECPKCKEKREREEGVKDGSMSGVERS